MRIHGVAKLPSKAALAEMGIKHCISPEKNLDEVALNRMRRLQTKLQLRRVSVQMR